MMLGELPKEMQDIASDVVRNQMRSISNNGSPKPTSPHTPTHNHDLNSEEIYKSLKRTTAEIQNYSYETGSKLDRERDTTSHDSGISQMSIGNNDIKNDIVAIEERFENLHVRSTYATHSMNGLTETDSNGYDKGKVNSLLVHFIMKLLLYIIACFQKSMRSKWCWLF